MTASHQPFALDLGPDDWRDLLATWGEKPFRAKQVYRQLHERLAAGPEEMTDLSRALRARLAEEVRWSGLTLDRVLTCDDGCTRKALFQLEDGSPIETVLMLYQDRATVCVSSQSGCPMQCTFCATGKLGFLHDLSPGEIVEQVYWAERTLRGMEEERAAVGYRDSDRLLTNIVFMGMGEPFNNYDNWWAAVERLHEPDGYNMGARGFTVSTVGLVPGILRLADESLQVNLAISLHAPSDEIRSRTMPVNRRYPIADLIDAVRTYTEKTHRRVSFEYVLLQEENDLPEHAEELAGLLRGKNPLLCHVNLIPWNPVPGTPLGRSTRNRVLNFQRILQDRGVNCTVRVERGSEIAAACGQLAGAAQEG